MSWNEPHNGYNKSHCIVKHSLFYNISLVSQNIVIQPFAETYATQRDIKYCCVGIRRRNNLYSVNIIHFLLPCIFRIKYFCLRFYHKKMSEYQKRRQPLLLMTKGVLNVIKNKWFLVTVIYSFCKWSHWYSPLSKRLAISKLIFSLYSAHFPSPASYSFEKHLFFVTTSLEITTELIPPMRHNQIILLKDFSAFETASDKNKATIESIVLESIQLNSPKTTSCKCVIPRFLMLFSTFFNWILLLFSFDIFILTFHLNSNNF